MREFSELLRDTGFWPMEGAFVERWPPSPDERGTFYRAQIDGVRKTFAVDENGVRWEADYRVDLRKHGFRFPGSGKVRHLPDGFRMIWRQFRQGVGLHPCADLLFLCGAVASFVADVVVMLCVPKATRERWDEKET